jgi:two-component system response regulator YesN
MYSSLVVDDEPRHRKGLINIIKQFRPDYSVSGAKNGQEALEFIQSNHVDILITDVKMPVMDGLELTKRVLEFQKDIKIIILSAYAHFEYAQKAVSLGAFDYLLKPLDSDGIASMLGRVEEKLKQEQSALQEKKHLEDQLRNTLPVYLELQLNRWVNNELKESEINEIAQIFPFKGKGVVIASEIAGSMKKDEYYDHEEKEEIKLNIKYWMKEALNPLGHSLSFFLHRDERTMITIINSSEKGFNPFNNLHLLKDVIKNVESEYGFKITMGISEVADNIFDQIRKAYTQAVTALSYRFYLETDRIITFSQVNDENNEYKINMLKEEKELTMAIRQQQEDKAAECVDKLFEKLISNGYLKPQRFKDIAGMVILNQIGSLQDLVDEEHLDKLKSDALGKIACCNTRSQVKNETVSIISSLISTHTNAKKNKHEDIMKNCIQFIDTHFKEDISLEYVAEMFYFNASYFGSLFKSYTGTTFGQYLLKVRINKAREYLKNPVSKVYEVASMAGYSDPKYFIRVFKNEVGLSPDEYRRVVLGKKYGEAKC